MTEIRGGLEGYPMESELRLDEETGMPTGDRAVGSEFLRGFWKTFFDTGVVQAPTDALQVTADGGMALRVNPGICLIEGVLGRAKYPVLVTLPPSDPARDTFWRIFLRRDLSLAVRQIVAEVREGAPPPIREGDVWEIALADVSVPRLAQGLTQSNVTDRRNDPALCGHIRAPLNNPDLSAFVRQADAFMDEARARWRERMAAADGEWAAWTGLTAEEWTDWMRRAAELHGMMETMTFRLVNRNFDDPSAGRGCRIQVSGLDTDTVTETKTLAATGEKVAERVTIFGDGGIRTAIAHLPWEREEGGNKIISKEHRISVLTTFNNDGTITEEVS